MSGYAIKTTVPISQTRNEIERLCDKHGAISFATFTERTQSSIAFEIRNRRVLFRLPLPEEISDQERRSRWRGLLLCVKAKFEAIERGVETFEEAFLAHFMTQDGRTVAETAMPHLDQIAAGNVPLLPGPSR